MLPTTRLPGESAKAYEAFRAYLEAGPSRSIPIVRAKCGKSTRLLERWSSAFQWSERILTHHTEQAEIQRAADIEAAKEHAGRRQQRREEMEEHAFQTYQQLTAKIEPMLKWPLAKQVKENGGTTTVIMPANWRLGDVVRLIAGREMVRKVALGEGLSRGDIDGLDNGILAGGGTPGVIIQIEGAPAIQEEIVPLPANVTRISEAA